MVRIFLDASVLFSACYSASGHSRDLIRLALRGEIQLVISNYVIEEVRRNLAKTSKDMLLFLDFALENLNFEKVRPTKNQVIKAGKLIALKDAPILAGAKRAKVDLLVTLDRQHLLGKPELEEFSGLTICTPQTAMQIIGKKQKD